MPLSEHEERLLAQMEEALKAEDPRLVSTLTGVTRASAGFVVPIILVLLGFAIMVGGLISKVTLVGLGGFLLALNGAILALRRAQQPRVASESNRSRFGRSEEKARKRRRSLMERLEERWDERNGEQR